MAKYQHTIRTMPWKGKTYYFPMWREGPDRTWKYYQEKGKNKRCESLDAAQSHIASNLRG